MPKGLDDRRWDFSPKEESDAPRPTGPAHSVARVAVIWSEGLGDLGALLALYGAWRAPRTRRGRVGRRLAFTYLLLFSAVLVRHAMTLGYLSGRHGLSLALVSLPWAAAGLRTLGGRVAARLHFDEARAGRWRVAALAALVVVGIVAQAKPAHPSRWGHLAAGRWLAGHMGPADKVLDTRGWAAFVADRPAYDAWHLRQALTDASLAYVVVGSDELAAPSRRAATLRAVLAYAAEPAAAFPERLGGPGGGPEVRVYRFHRPASWEGLRP